MALVLYTPPPPNLLNSMKYGEGLSNGVWNSIVTLYFKNPDWIVMPEFHQDGSRPDLLVCPVANWPQPDTINKTPGLNTPKLVFEGKIMGGTAAWNLAQMQALRYMNTYNCKVAMVAIADKVVFLTPTADGKDDRQLKFKEGDAAAGTVDKLTCSTGSTPMSIDTNRTQIANILTFIANNGTIPVPTS